LRLIHSNYSRPSMVSKVTRIVALMGILLFIAHASTAGEVKFSASLDAEAIEQQINVVDGDVDIGSSNQIIRPIASIRYISRDLNAFLQGTHNHVRRQLDGSNNIQDYPSLSYTGSYDVVKGLLSLNAGGSQSYRNEGVNTFLLDDFLLNGDNLNKVTSHRASATLSLPRGKYFGLDSTAEYSKNKSDNNNQNSSSVGSLFDSQGYTLSLSALSGKRIRGIRSILTGNLNFVKRSSQEDFFSQRANLSNDIKVYKQLGIALNASYENNELKSDTDTSFDGFREFYSIGAGLVWQATVNRSIEIAWNRSYTEPVGGIGETEDKNFISYDINWAFSDRTSIQGQFTRRFFGDAGNLSIIHQLRNWRSSLTYNETVNSTSQLANRSDQALFICEGGSTNIADCLLSDSLSPDLEQGQVLQPIVVQSFGLNDRIILNKSLTAQTAVTRRRTTISLTGTKSEIEELEFDRVIDTANIRFQVAFKLSNRTGLSISSNYSVAEFVNTGEQQKQTTREQSIELTRQLSERFTVAINLRHLDRKGEAIIGNNANFGGLNGPLTDNRATFKVSYKFGKG
jgi:uncharacterized protein (PEP-CTERM system associated)